MGDHSAFVEPYSYGKLEDPSQEQEDIFLGSDMPLLEYQRRLDPVYTRVMSDLRKRQGFDPKNYRPQPYPLLETHFEYAWSRAVAM